MRFSSQRLTAAALAIVAVAVLAGSAAGGSPLVLDQSQTDSSAGTECICEPFTRLAQTLTAGVTGEIGRVDLLLQRVGAPGALLVQLQTATDGLPSGTTLAAAAVSGADVPTGASAWVSVQFEARPVVTAGSSYAIVLSAEGTSSGAPFFAWDVALGNPYGGGQATTSVDHGSSWIPLIGLDGASLDRAFRTFVVQPAAEQLADLQGVVEGLPPGASLADKIQRARDALAAGDGEEACDVLQAFVYQVTAQRGKLVAESLADELLESTARIEEMLAC